MTAISILGGGCTGPLIALLLQRRGHVVTLYERRPDPRRHSVPAGRSINLALADRGIRALEQAGLMDELRPMLVPMHSRMIHEIGKAPLSLRYGQKPEELLWSASRAMLHRALIESAVAAGVECRFGQSLVDADFASDLATLEDVDSKHRYSIRMSPVIAADGAGSVMRKSMMRAGLCSSIEDVSPHSYKEFHIDADPSGAARLSPEHLHIWPRGSHMLIALPNADNSLTATLFMPTAGADASFAALEQAADAHAFFEREFPDALALIDDFEKQHLNHPVGRLATVYTNNWHVDSRVLLIGDAAHGIVPFHGQGLNCCFEDCLALDRLLDEHSDWQSAFAAFSAERRPNSDAIARMAIDNYLEMRDAVRKPSFQLQKELSLALERRHPKRFIPRYSMVMFHAEIPYAEAERRGEIQLAILEETTRGLRSLDEVDLAYADHLVMERLTILAERAS